MHWKPKASCQTEGKGKGRERLDEVTRAHKRLRQRLCPRSDIGSDCNYKKTRPQWRRGVAEKLFPVSAFCVILRQDVSSQAPGATLLGSFIIPLSEAPAWSRAPTRSPSHHLETGTEVGVKSRGGETSPSQITSTGLNT